MDRASGVLMAISSLPSPYGIGTLGSAAYAFADFLAAAGQRVWQLLPLGPTSYGDSPYSSFSSFAGNPYYVDLDMLAGEGLLDKGELERLDWGSDPAQVDYGRLYEQRFAVLEQACHAGWERAEEELAAFARENAAWLDDYTLFMALKRHFGMLSWQDWPDEAARRRTPAALERYRTLLADDIRLFTFIQYHFFRQWEALRRYVHEKGIRLLCDLPIYVALDSADVWAAPENFQLDEDLRPERVAGVPPDAFSADGQLWGNPLYRWEHMAHDGYGWWIRRVAGTCRLCDMVRIDHFRGFESYWSVPAGESTARSGRWCPGPGMALVGVLKNWFGNTQFIAEDLGYLTPGVKKLLADSGFPGMKVLEFAFDADGASDYLPHRHERGSVCYVGTHDNQTLAQWLTTAAPETLTFARDYLGLNEREGYAWGVLRGGLSSVADLFVAPMQDYLGLSGWARMNEPGTDRGNWRWRLRPGELTEELARRMRLCARRYGR